MSNQKHRTTTTSSAAETEALAEQLAKNLRGGEAIELISDLGGGKTTFVRGLARGLDIKSQVTSPTFTVNREYSGRLRLHHYDFYRLNVAGIMSAELSESVSDKAGVVVV